MSRLTFSGLTKRFGPITAVDDVALDISSGEFVSLVGASGCGKTTLLRMIAGFTRPDAGEMTIDGRRVDVLPPSRREVGFVFQSYALFPTQTVAGNIGFSLRIRKRERREIEERVGELCRLTQLTGLEDRYPHELSGGQQQRVALARALAPNPAILLLDEPLSALDAKIRAHLRTEIRRIVDRLGITTVYVTHDQEEALSISDRVAVMHRGRILQVGPPMELYLDPVHRYVAEFIGTSNRLAGRALGGGRFETEGMTVEARCPTPLDGAGECVVCVRPEHVELMHDGNDIGCGSGRVVSTSFLGPTVRCRLETANGSELVVDVSTVEWLDKALSLGDAVAWRVRASRAMAFPPGEAGAGQGELDT